MTLHSKALQEQHLVGLHAVDIDTHTKARPACCCSACVECSQLSTAKAVRVLIGFSIPAGLYCSAVYPDWVGQVLWGAGPWLDSALQEVEVVVGEEP